MRLLSMVLGALYTWKIKLEWSASSTNDPNRTTYLWWSEDEHYILQQEGHGVEGSRRECLEIASRNFSADGEVDLSWLTHRDVDGETRDP